jgi:hypothetical protein
MKLYSWLDAKADDDERLWRPVSWLFIYTLGDLREDVGLRRALPRRKWLRLMFLDVMSALPALCKLVSALCYTRLTGRPPWA